MCTLHERIVLDKGGIFGWHRDVIYQVHFGIPDMVVIFLNTQRGCIPTCVKQQTFINISPIKASCHVSMPTVQLYQLSKINHNIYIVVE